MNYNYSQVLLNSFKNAYHEYLTDIVNTNVSLDRCNVCSRLFEVDCSSDIFEIPVFARNIIEFYLHSSIRDNKKIDKFIIPLYENSVHVVKGTSEAIMKDFMCTHLYERLKKVSTTKNEVYYGVNGLIMDKDYNILFLETLKGLFIDKEGKKTIEYTGPVIYINPIVFTNKDLISKHIVKILIPFFANSTLSRISSNFYIICHSQRIQLIIKDTTNLIKTPTKPNIRINLKENINNCLVENIKDIINDF